MVKRTLSGIIFSGFTAVASATVVGNGEYRFGPETAENIACANAEQEAKKNAIEKFVGEMIEHQTDEVCRDENCTTYRKYFSDVSGEIVEIIKKNRYVAPEHKHSVCYVDILANVQKIQNPIQLKIDSKRDFQNGERFSIQAVSNHIGIIAVFNYTNNNYRLIHTSPVTVANKEFTLPSGNQKFEAKTQLNSSKEKLVFLFTNKQLTFGERYSTIEFDQLVSNINFVNRKLVNHQINIMR